MSKDLTGIERIAAERARQKKVEGWTDAHDDEHVDGSLAYAAICYLAPEPVFVKRGNSENIVFSDPWPRSWSPAWDRRTRNNSGQLTSVTLEKRIRDLEKAGALVAAEIDRLLRRQS